MAWKWFIIVHSLQKIHKTNLECLARNNIINTALQQNTKLTQFVYCMPKIELHIHLEGTIRPKRAISLIRRYNPDSPIKSAEDVEKQYRFGNLPDFLRAMQSITDYLRSPEDLYETALDMLHDLVRQNVHYVEFDCNIYKYMLRGFTAREVINALKSAIYQVQADSDLGVGIVLNLVRKYGPEASLEAVKSVVDLNDDIIVGVGLSGDENQHPPELFQDAFSLARQHGLGVTVHAGEASGPDSIWKALTTLSAQRIDHGTRAKDDPALLDYLAQQQIPLTMCPTSNLLLKVVDSYSEHPIKDYFDRGIPVNVNSDDPAIFNTNITRELLIITEVFNFTAAELEKLMINAIQATFLSLPRKTKLFESVVGKINALRAEMEL